MIATASNGEVEHEILSEKILHRTLSVIWIWTIKESFYLFELSFNIGYWNLFRNSPAWKDGRSTPGSRVARWSICIMFCSNDWPPGLNYFLVVLNTVAVEGVSVQKTAVDAGHKFLSVHAFHPQKDRAKHLNPSFSAILSHRINMLAQGRPALARPLRSGRIGR